MVNIGMYCVKCRKKTQSENERVVKSGKGRLMMKGACSVCKTNQSQFISAKTGGNLVQEFIANTVSRVQSVKDLASAGIKDGVSGIRAEIKNQLSKRPLAFEQTLRKYGSKKITNIKVCRVPISSFVTKALDLMTRGKFSKNAKGLGYDSIFHLFMILELEGGVKILTERNQRIGLKKISKEPTGKDAECKDDFQNPGKSLEEFITAAEKKEGPGIYRYDARTNNCQMYVTSLLKANGIAKNLEWINQDAEKLLTPKLGKIGRALTDVAATAELLVKGGKKK